MGNAQLATIQFTTSVQCVFNLGEPASLRVYGGVKTHFCSKPLAFYSVSFGSERYSASLRQMANVAREVYQRAPLDPLTTARGNPCSYANAIDSVSLLHSAAMI